VGPDPGLEGLWYATGHGRQGILLAALTGEIIGALLTAEQIDIDWAPMQPRA
jgi:glycine oxidase